MEINKLKKIEELNKEVPLFLIDNYLMKNYIKN